MKSREEWESELRERQRNNYVFPGTVINQTAMYRNILRPTFPLTRFQRVSILFLGLFQIIVTMFFIVMSVAAWFYAPDIPSKLSGSWYGLVSMPFFYLGIKMTIRAISSPHIRPSARI